MTLIEYNIDTTKNYNYINNTTKDQDVSDQTPEEEICLENKNYFSILKNIKGEDEI